MTTHLFLGATEPHGLPYPVTLGGSVTIMGGAGCGKTTLAREIAAEARRAGADVTAVLGTECGDPDRYQGVAHEVTTDTTGALRTALQVMTARETDLRHGRQWSTPLVLVLDDAHHNPHWRGEPAAPAALGARVDAITQWGAATGVTVVYVNARPRLTVEPTHAALCRITRAWARPLVGDQPVPSTLGRWLFTRPHAAGVMGVPSEVTIPAPAQRADQ
ncbi:AAA domain-containing protein [Nocardiopsis flavescens]|uniref:AAA domain-containing protein n=1 Tax=Nocardiopsis flavescens TaxID=758803 RepID=A0A1M6WQC2_9ACTN|nr:ATP-binding protein [Nocardiopsis flavescens]SHK95918.1 AAA domain-containing protein [Nocardiopsis flavescens]